MRSSFYKGGTVDMSFPSAAAPSMNSTGCGRDKPGISRGQSLCNQDHLYLNAYYHSYPPGVSKGSGSNRPVSKTCLLMKGASQSSTRREQSRHGSEVWPSPTWCLKYLPLTSLPERKKQKPERQKTFLSAPLHVSCPTPNL